MRENGICRLKNGTIERYWKSEGESSAIFSKDYLFGSNYNRDNKTLTVMFYNRQSQKKIWQQDYENRRSSRFACEHLFLTDINFTYIDNINLKTGKSDWILDPGMEIYRNILKYENILIIPLKNNHLLGINAQTGEKLWELEDCLNYQMLDEKTGLLYSYGAERYEIIDAFKGKKVLQKKFEGSMDKYGIFVPYYMSNLYGDSIYFTSNQKQIKFGKINIHTHEIEFVQELVEDKERIGRASASKPIYHNGRLYILDSAGTLHIFEEE